MPKLLIFSLRIVVIASKTSWFVIVLYADGVPASKTAISLNTEAKVLLKSSLNFSGIRKKLWVEGF